MANKKKTKKGLNINVIILLFSIIAVLFVLSITTRAFGKAGDSNACITIKSGNILYPAGHYLVGQQIKAGADVFGFDYQKQVFTGYFINAFIGEFGLPPYTGVVAGYPLNDLLSSEHFSPGQAQQLWDSRDWRMQIQWNDAWLSRTDCDSNAGLDRHFGFNSYMGSGAWTTYHISGEYPDLVDSTIIYKWNQYFKVEGVPLNARLDPDTKVWFNADGSVFGPESPWSAAAITHDVYNDQGTGHHGLVKLSW